MKRFACRFCKTEEKTVTYDKEVFAYICSNCGRIDKGRTKKAKRTWK